jgi:hypothetical protein
MMLRLIYISSSSSMLTATEMDLLVAQADQHNMQCGLTGVLLYSGSEFVQCLEGDLKQVSAVYQSILMDSRHHDVRLVQAMPVGERLFAGWGLFGFRVGAAASANAQPTAYSYLDQRLCRSWSNLGVGAVDMVQEYSRVKNELERMQASTLFGRGAQNAA